MGLILGCIQEQESGEYARGDSPFIIGYPTEVYRTDYPFKIGFVHPEELVFTDPITQLKTILGIQERYRKSILKSLKARKLELPLLSPIIVDEGLNIHDGNHRALAAAIHGAPVRAILIKTNRDIKALRALERQGLLYWPHGAITYKGLNEKFEDCGANNCLGDAIEQFKDKALDEIDYEKARFTDLEDRIDYAISRFFFQKTNYLAGETRSEPDQDLHLADLASKKEFDSADYDPEKIYSLIKTRIKEFRLPFRRNLYDEDDLTQEVVDALRRV